MADGENAFAVTPSGGMVKCWNEVTTPGAEVRHLLRPTTGEMLRSAERWRQRDPFSLECRECLSLPICMGGCPYIYMTTGKLHCHPWKHHPAENLVFYYFLQKHRQESEIVQKALAIVDGSSGKKPVRSGSIKAPMKKRFGEREALT
jgi:uncharacterized protein